MSDSRRYAFLMSASIEPNPLLYFGRASAGTELARDGDVTAGKRILHCDVGITGRLDLVLSIGDQFIRKCKGLI